MSSAQFEVTSRTARIMIVDDHPTVREGLEHRISSQPDMSVCGEAEDAASALKAYPALAPDLVIVDIALKGSNGLELIKTLKARHPDVRALVHSMYDESIYAGRCLTAGALGYVNKGANPNEVIKAIREILAGRIYLSPAMTSQILNQNVRGAERVADAVEGLTDRQLEIFRLIGEGLSATQIGARLHISVHTVESHRENIKRKLNVDSLSDLSRRAVLWVAENH